MFESSLRHAAMLKLLGRVCRPFESHNARGIGRDGNWTQAQWTPAKNTHNGWVNARIVGYGYEHG